MECPSQPQRKPILNSRVNINSFASYQNFRKKFYKPIKSATIQYGRRDLDFHPFRDQRFIKRFLKISNRLRYTSFLRLHGVFLESLKISPSVAIDLARKLQNIKQLSLTDAQHLSFKHFTFVETWLRRLRDLQSLKYRVIRSNEKFVRKHKPIPNKNLLISSRLHKNLKILQVSYPLYNQAPFTKAWDFSSYPQSIQNLSIKGGIHSSSSLPGTSPSFDSLKNLQQLKMSFDSATSTNFILEKFREISNCHQLKSLDLHLGKGSHDLCLQMSATEGFKGLEKLRLSILNSCPGVPELIGTFQHCKLTDLCLVLEVANEGQFQTLKSQIHHFQALMSFKLKITNRSFYQNKTIIEDLINEINQFEILELLQLSFETSMSENLQKFVIKDFVPNFKPLFTKSIKLTTFSFKSNQIQISSPTFLDLIDSIENTIAKNLFKLRIEVGEFQPAKTEYDAVLKFVKSLKNIQILKLKSLKIPVKKFFHDLIDSIYTLSHLRVLYFGMLNGMITIPAIIDGIHRVLLKKGLEVFDYNVTHDLA